MESILNITVSKYNHYSGKYPEDCNLLEYLNDYSMETNIITIRSKDSKDERDELKAKLPGITPSAICYPSRSEKNVVRKTGLMSFDIDKIEPENIELIKKKIINIPFVAYCGLSASGRGFWGLVPISNPSKYEQHFKALQLYFKSLGIDRPYFDTAVKDIARFRYYSVDRSAYFNHNAKVFDYIYEEPTQAKNTNKQKFKNSRIDIFDTFNKYGDIENLLITHGWTYQPQFDKGTCKRFSRPEKSKGVSADFCTERRILYVFTDSTNFESSKGFNPVSVFCELECNNDWKLCSKKLNELYIGIE